jgi:hypothetical protein
MDQDQGGFQFVTVNQAAARAGISASRVRLLASQGRFPGAVKVARDWLLPVTSVETWLQKDRDRRFKPGGP